MFIGHFAVGLASKRAAPRTSLGWLMAAPMALDLLFPILLVAGIERASVVPNSDPFLRMSLDAIPWSHSLATSALWSVLGGGIYWLATRYQRGAIVIALGIFSHWLLDAITHTPDMPLWPGSTTNIGLGLWRSPAVTIVIEMAMFLGAAWLYARTTRARDAVGRWAFIAFVVVWVVAYIASTLPGPLPSVRAMEYGSLVTFLIPVWAWWFDAHRQVTAS